MKLIAETAWHHDGDFTFFKSLVDRICSDTKADYIKFHITLKIDEYMSDDHPIYEWCQDRLFNREQWSEIIDLTITNGKKIMLLFNDSEAVEFGMQYKPEIVEIHSTCLNDLNLLKCLRDRIDPGTKVALGVGGSELDEIENAAEKIETRNIVLMHGFQNYPTKYEDVNFKKIKKIMSLYPNYEHGYADHTGWDNENNLLITLFGAALGMEYVEKHVTTQFGKERADWQAAISVQMFEELTQKIKLLELANGNGQLRLNSGERSYSTFGRNKKAALLNQDVTRGQKFTENLFDFKRTGQESDMSQIEVIEKMGSSFSRDLKEGHCLLKSDFEKR